VESKKPKNILAMIRREPLLVLLLVGLSFAIGCRHTVNDRTEVLEDGLGHFGFGVVIDSLETRNVQVSYEVIEGAPIKSCLMTTSSLRAWKPSPSNYNPQSDSQEKVRRLPDGTTIHSMEMRPIADFSSASCLGTDITKHYISSKKEYNLTAGEYVFVMLTKDRESATVSYKTTATPF
jgi:hypothetical protein